MLPGSKILKGFREAVKKIKKKILVARPLRHWEFFSAFSFSWWLGPYPSLLVAGPLKKRTFFAASLNVYANLGGLFFQMELVHYLLVPSFSCLFAIEKYFYVSLDIKRFELYACLLPLNFFLPTHIVYA